MSTRRLRSAIAGLGQVGMLFDEEPERRASGEVWTHFTAYERLAERYDLVAAVDTDPGRRAMAEARRPGLCTYDSVAAMLAAGAPDVVSVCTPDAVHLDVVRQLAGSVRGIFLEKPLCTREQLPQAEAVAEVLRASGCAVRVNYYKRVEPLFLELSRRLAGWRVVNVCARYSGPFDAVGSHALDLLLAVASELKLVDAWRTPHAEGDGYSASLRTGAVSGQLLYCGPRHELIFELEVVGDSGRLVLERNLSELAAHGFEPSGRYKGYRELSHAQRQEAGPNTGRFVRTLVELADAVEQGAGAGDGLGDALRTQRAMSAIEALARQREGGA